MRRTLASALGCLALATLLGFNTQGQDAEAKPNPDPKALIGTWVVDLRQKPADKPYLKEFVVSATESNGLTGTFYDSEIKNGRTNKDWSNVHFAFTTQDGGGGTYNTSGKLVGDKIEGMSHSLGRNFLIVWTGTRKPDGK